MAQFRLKQLVWVPTRAERTLDLHCTNMAQLYNKELVQTLPPFDLLTIRRFYWSPNQDACTTPAVFVLLLKGTHIDPSCKCELSRYLGYLDWSALVFASNCDSKLQLFRDLIKISLDTIIRLTFARTSDYTWTMLLGWLLSSRLLSSCSKRRSCQVSLAPFYNHLHCRLSFQWCALGRKHARD